MAYPNNNPESRETTSRYNIDRNSMVIDFKLETLDMRLPGPDGLTAEELGYLDGIEDAYYNLDSILYRNAYNVGKIEAGFEQIRNAFNMAPAKLYGGVAEKKQVIDTIEPVALNIASDPDYAKRVAEAAQNARAKREAAEKQRVETMKTQGLTMGQGNLLAAPKLQTGKIVSEILGDSSLDTEEKKKAALKNKLTQKISVEYKKWLTATRKLTSGGKIVTAQLSGFESQLAEDKYNIKVPGAQLAGKALSGTASLGGELLGNFKGLQHSKISSHPLLSQVFTDQESLAAAYANLSADTTSDEQIEKFIGDRVEVITGKLSFSAVAQNFQEIPSSPEEMSDEQLKLMIDKMEAIPKFFKKTKFASQYYDYLTGVGSTQSGDVSHGKSFEEWFSGLELHPMSKLFYSFMMMVPDFVIDFIDGKEGNKTDEQKDGKKLTALKQELEAKGLGTGEDDEDEPSTKPVGKFITKLRTVLDEAGSPNKEINIKNNDVSLQESELSGDDEDVLESLTSFVEKRPEARSLLTSGLRLEDLKMLLNNLDRNDMQINFYETGFEMIPDGSLLASLQDFDFGIDDAAYMGIGTVAGFGAKSLLNRWGGLSKLRGGGKFGAIARFVGYIGIAIGAEEGVRGLGDLITKGGGIKFDYETLKTNPEQFNVAMGTLRRILDVGVDELAPEKIKKNYADRFVKSSITNAAGQKIEKTEAEITAALGNVRIPPELIDDGRLRPSFYTLLALPNSFWNGYTMTQDDMNNFVANLDKGWTDLTGSIDDEKNAVFGSNGKYIVEGSGWALLAGFKRKEVKDAAGFFEWLRS